MAGGAEGLRVGLEVQSTFSERDDVITNRRRFDPADHVAVNAERLLVEEPVTQLLQGVAADAR